MYSLFWKSGIFRSERERERDVFCAIRSVPNLCVGSGLRSRALAAEGPTQSGSQARALLLVMLSIVGVTELQTPAKKFWIYEIIQEITMQITSKASKWKMLVK
jgi:hypothetical protein